MSRKDFELIAKALKDTMPNETPPYQGEKKNQWCMTTLRFAQELKTTNPRFNQERFLRACGY